MGDPDRPHRPQAPRRRGRSLGVLVMAALVVLAGSVAYLEQNAPGVLPRIPGLPLEGRASPAGTPVATHSPMLGPQTRVPSPIPDNLPSAPPELPLIWFQEGRTGIDFVTGWDGRLYSIPISTGAPVCGSLNPGFCAQSPDGSWLVIDDGNTLSAYARSNSAKTPLGPSAPFLWADDGRRICVMSRLPGPTPDVPSAGRGPTQLMVVAVDSWMWRPVAAFGEWTFNGSAGPRILACSVKQDMAAMLSQTKSGSTLRVVRLSTGDTLNDISLSPGQFPIFSPDGSVLAIDDLQSGGTRLLSSLNPSHARSLTGALLVAMSWYGTEALVVGPSAAGLIPGNAPRMVDLTTGKAFWIAPAGSIFAGRALAEPRGVRLAVQLDACPGCPHELWVTARAHGAARMVVSGVSLDTGMAT